MFFCDCPPRGRASNRSCPLASIASHPQPTPLILCRHHMLVTPARTHSSGHCIPSPQTRAASGWAIAHTHWLGPTIRVQSSTTPLRSCTQTAHAPSTPRPLVSLGLPATLSCLCARLSRLQHRAQAWLRTMPRPKLSATLPVLMEDCPGVAHTLTSPASSPRGHATRNRA